MDGKLGRTKQIDEERKRNGGNMRIHASVFAKCRSNDTV